MINTPEPRLPLEPEEYPLYNPPKRVGCSALTILPLLLVGIFALLFFRITPNLAQGIVNPVRQILGVSTPTAVPDTSADAGTGALATQTVAVLPTVSPTPPKPTAVPPTPTAIPEEYVQVANTGGQGVRLRAQPHIDAPRVDGLAEGVVCKIIGPDQENADGIWRNVTVVSNGNGPGNGETGWILAKWLAPAKKP